MIRNITKLQLKQTFLDVSIRKLLCIISDCILNSFAVFYLGTNLDELTKVTHGRKLFHHHITNRPHLRQISLKNNYTPWEKTDQWRTKKRKKTGHGSGPLLGSACPTGVRGQDGRRRFTWVTCSLGWFVCLYAPVLLVLTVGTKKQEIELVQKKIHIEQSFSGYTSSRYLTS